MKKKIIAVIGNCLRHPLQAIWGIGVLVVALTWGLISNPKKFFAGNPTR